MKIYTKTGDNGETGLFGGKRVKKSDKRISAYGTIDELNAHLGLAKEFITSEEIKSLIEKLQNLLFNCGADLATPLEEISIKISIPRIDEKDIEFVEKNIDYFESKLEPLKNFILPGGSKGAALLHLCRTVCRRAEREIVALEECEVINHKIVIFANRISDLLFVLSRIENKTVGIPDLKWLQ